MKEVWQMSGCKLVAHDWCDDPNPIPLWRGVSDHYFDGDTFDDAVDKHVNWIADADPRPRPLIGGYSTHCRELIADPYAVSLWDAEWQPGSTRTQLINNSATNTFDCIREGERKTIWCSIKLDTVDKVLNGVNDISGGIQSMIWQYHGIGDSGSPTLICSEMANGFGIRCGGDRFVPCPRGVWVQMAVAVLYSSDPAKGALRIWADLGDGKGLLPRSDKITGIATRGSSDGAFSIGPYQRLPFGPDGWPQAPQKVRRRYSNVAIVSVPLSNPW
jgi:hypothetical protein